MEKPIYLSRHAQEQLAYRGTNAEEIITVIRGSKWEKAEMGRMSAKKDFSYDKEWNNKRYAKKQVKPIFVEEKDKIIIVTVYVYYFQ